MTAIVTSAVTDSVGGGLGASLAVVVTVSLIALLVARELAGASEGRKFKIFSEYTLVTIVPLLIAFALIVLVTTLEILP